MSETKWEEQTGSGMWMPENPGDSLEGTVIDVKEGTYGNQYVIKKADNEEVLTPSHKVLQNRMGMAVKGTTVRITYVKSELPTVKGNHPTRIYKVEFAKTAEEEVKAE